MTRLTWIAIACAFGGWAQVAAAEVERFAVVIGNNAGALHETELRYAEDDAAKVAEVLESVGGVEAENLVLLRGRDANAVRKALVAVNGRIRRRIGAGHETLLLVYYSGHADATTLHLDGSELPLDEIEELVRGSAAGIRLLVLDSCRSGALTRVKGGKSAPPLILSVNDALAGEGVIFLTASSASEDAQESDEIQGSFFTHFFVSGLLGAADADGDDQVVLEEAYRHAYDQTVLASSRTLAGLQHPTFRYELSGQRDLVLTRVGRQRDRGRVRFPAGRVYIVANDDGDVVAEVSTVGRARILSLRAGRYFVRARAHDHMLEGKVRVDAGIETTLDDRRLKRFAYARLVRKGGGAGVTHGPAIGYTVRSAIIEGAGRCQGPAFSYPVELSRATVSPRISMCRGGFTNETLSAHTDALAVNVRLTHAWDLPVVTLELGVVLGAQVLRQTFFDTLATAPDRTGVGAHVDVTAGAILDLPAGYYAAFESAAQTHFVSIRDMPVGAGDDAPTSLASRFATAATLLVGRRW